jgi:hypothetical protein
MQHILTAVCALIRSMKHNSSCDDNIHNISLLQCKLNVSTPHSDLEDLKRTADCSTQFDSALTSAIKREREVTVKTEAMRALHKNLGE